MMFKIALDQPTRRCMETGLLQGLFLLGMHKAIQHSFWPLNRPTALVPLYLLILSIPLVLELLSDRFDRPLVWKYTAGLSAVLALMALYTVRTEEWVVNLMRGSGGEPVLLGCLAISATLICYISIAFAQARLAGGGPGFSYRHLFEYSWNNIVTLQSAWMFCLIFWMLLGLLGGLFAVLGIQFFVKLYIKPIFFYPVTTGALAYGVSFSRMHGTLVLGQRNTLLLIFKNLLPVAAGIALLFLAALPFTGLQPIWKTGHATVLLVNLQVCLIFFFNAVYQDGSAAERPYALWIRRLVLLGLLTLPVYSAISVYSLGLRVVQHGWSVSRVLAALIVATTALYSAGYGWTVLRRQAAWMRGIEGVNVQVAAVILLLAVSVHTPLLDPRLISARSQVSRLTSGKVSPEKFDFDYLRFRLGSPGADAVRRLSKLENHPKAAQIRKLAQASLEKKNYSRYGGGGPETNPSLTADQLGQRIHWFPAGHPADAGVVRFLFEQREQYPYKGWNTTEDENRIILMADLSGDAQEEAVVFIPDQQTTPVLVKGENGWAQGASLQGEWLDPKTLREKMSAGDYQIRTASWKEITIGDKVFYIYSKDKKK